ncbi:MAG: NAD-dependent epimerase/dehydratase family protein [Anaerolineales bacterium]|nr:MAG: NAD-dependent epimerase/dehydratase family protein [Anaerolineales bacterium]
MTDLALVTGATGFVGSALCRTLVDSGMGVRALHRPSSSLKNLEGLSLDFFEGDILDRARMDQACVNVRWVFHTASNAAYWRNPASVKQTAVEGTRNVAEAALAAGVERLVFTSSIAAMGLPAGSEFLTEAHRFNLREDQFPYGAAKYQAELALHEIIGRGLDAVIVNPTIILGPGDVNLISGSLVTEAARGMGFFYLAGGGNYIHIDDVAAGHLAAAEHGQCGQGYILGGENLAHKDAFTILNQVVGRPPPWLKIPGWVVPPAAWLIDRLRRWIQIPIDGDQLRMSRAYLYCDIAKAQKELLRDKPISFRRAVEDAYRWYLQEGIIPSRKPKKP